MVSGEAPKGRGKRENRTSHGQPLVVYKKLERVSTGQGLTRWQVV